MYWLRLEFTKEQKKMFDYVVRYHMELEGNAAKVAHECIRREFLRCQDERQRTQAIKDKVASLTDEQVKRLIAKMCEEPEQKGRRNRMTGFIQAYTDVPWQYDGGDVCNRFDPCIEEGFVYVNPAHIVAAQYAEFEGGIESRGYYKLRMVNGDEYYTYADTMHELIGAEG